MVKSNDDGLDVVEGEISSSSFRDDRERMEPNRLDGRPSFCEARGRSLVISRESRRLESVLSILGLVGPELDVGDPSLEKEVGRRFLSVVGALSGGSSLIGVKGCRGGRKTLRLRRRRLSDMPCDDRSVSEAYLREVGPGQEGRPSPK